MTRKGPISASTDSICSVAEGQSSSSLGFGLRYLSHPLSLTSSSIQGSLLYFITCSKYFLHTFQQKINAEVFLAVHIRLASS